MNPIEEEEKALFLHRKPAEFLSPTTWGNWLKKAKPMTQEDVDKNSPYLLYIDENFEAKLQPKAKAGIIRPKDKIGRKNLTKIK